ncbi:MAG: 5-dehydro-4-deoxy-D-glucuronate isomerase [Pedobacter sp.]|nr:5-dehydro-4-deoxy-D-glucuronate isomerase [Chitinophagaceae bacterium]
MSAISLKTLHSVHFNDAKNYTTQQLREQFLLDGLEKNDAIELTYMHYDRMIAGLAKPVNATLTLPTYVNLKSDYFLERRELGIINTGSGQGTVTVDGKAFQLNKYDCLYIGKGVKDVTFASANAVEPAIFFLLSTPAHQTYPTRLMTIAESTVLELGAKETCNERSLCKYIHNDGIQSCQLVMGITMIKSGSVWNSVPPHTHDRRSEVYFYFDLAADNRIFHIMGQPQETRHLVVANNEAIVSASWGMHFGCGTGNYSFIWAMAGENKEFTDMDPAPIATLL